MVASTVERLLARWKRVNLFLRSLKVIGAKAKAKVTGARVFGDKDTVHHCMGTLKMTGEKKQIKRATESGLDYLGLQS